MEPDKREEIERLIEQAKQAKVERDAMRRFSLVEGQKERALLQRTKDQAAFQKDEIAFFDSKERGEQLTVAERLAARQAAYRRAFVEIKRDGDRKPYADHSDGKTDRHDRPGEKVLYGTHHGLTPVAQAEAGKTIKRNRGRGR